MAYTPQPPFPKSRGDTMRSGDWNDAVNEVLRLETAKLNRAGDTVAGSLSIDGANANSGAKDPSLSFGAGSGEGIASPRTANAPNRFGLDFFTGSQPRLTIDNAGRVGIGIRGPQAALDVQSGDVRWSRSRLVADQGGSLELGGDNGTAATGTPYIDFHFGSAVQDYNVRLINNANRQLWIDCPGGQVVVAGGLRVTGNHNIISAWTQTLWAQNAGLDTPSVTRVDYSAAGFAQVYCVVPIFQGFSLYAGGPTTGLHSIDTTGGAFSQHAWVTVDAGWTTTSAVVRTYCSEARREWEGDNTIFVTLLVLGRT